MHAYGMASGDTDADNESRRPEHIECKFPFAEYHEVKGVFYKDLLNAYRRLKGMTRTPQWHVLCLAFKSIDAEFIDPAGARRIMAYTMSDGEMEKAKYSFRRYPALAEECSAGLADIVYDIVDIERPINSLTAMGDGGYWVSPCDVKGELDEYAPPGAYDSVFVHWPQTDLSGQVQIPSPGWGLAIGPDEGSNGATYCTIANAPVACWNVSLSGEVWLHEWLHGVCDFYESKGFRMPQHNADGGGSHGYTRSPVTGWCGYYKDLMTGRVKENGRLTGITPEAWLSGTVRDTLRMSLNR